MSFAQNFEKLGVNPELPEGYHFADRAELAPTEIMNLRETLGWDPRTEKRWQLNIEKSLAVISVRTVERQLVGVGFLAGNQDHAVLCDVCVHPDHQRSGIGMAIGTELVRTAEEQEIPYLYANLAGNNPFRGLLKAIGFTISPKTEGTRNAFRAKQYEK